MNMLQEIRTTAVVLLLMFFAIPSSQAFLDPSIGRWANRDPIEETGGKNLYAFIANAPVGQIDRLGLIRFGDDNWNCRLCVCKDVTITYEPGGESMHLDWYKEGWDANGDVFRFGSKIHVKWNVEGDPRECRYFQDEGNTKTTVERFIPSSLPAQTTVGKDGNAVGYDYFDYMGAIPPPGTSWKWTLNWDVVFRCVSSKPFKNTVTHRVTKNYFPVFVESKDNPNPDRR